MKIIAYSVSLVYVKRAGRELIIVLQNYIIPDVADKDAALGKAIRMNNKMDGYELNNHTVLEIIDDQEEKP